MFNRCACNRAIVSEKGDICNDCKPWCKCGERKADIKDNYAIVAYHCYECTPKCPHGVNGNKCDWCVKKFY